MNVLPRAGWPRGLFVALATVAVMTALQRSPFGDWALNAIIRGDGEPSAHTVAFATLTWLVGAALGVWSAAPRDGAPGTDEANTAALAVTAPLAILAPLALVAGGPDLASFGRLLLGVLALELATAAGGLLGLASLRGWTPGPVVQAAALFLLLVLAARAAVIGVFEPLPLIDPAGRITGHALDALRAQERWLPLAGGAAALLATAACAPAIGRGPALAMVALVPLVLRAAGVALGTVWAGTPVLSAGSAVEWLYLAAGGTAGALTGLATRKREARSAAPLYG